MQHIEIQENAKLQDYRAYGALTHAAADFLKRVSQPVEDLKGCTIWMVNSTATGGGVAEMLPSQMSLMREQGVSVEWLVIDATDEHFFDLTKRIHNAIHGSGTGKFTEEDRAIFQAVNENNVARAIDKIQDGDLVVIHDPQPMPLAAMIRKHRNVKTIWRCHIGLEEDNEVTDGVWSFLSHYFDDYDHFVFSLTAYVPESIKEKTAIITPAIDPLSHKNRILQMHKIIGILHQSGIIDDRPPILYEMYDHQVRRVQPDGSFGEVNAHSKLDMIYRPTALEISRWDRLKGWHELMQAFISMKRYNESHGDPESREYKRIQKSRLVLGGPDPKFVSDDPEGTAVLNELIEEYKSIDGDLQDDIAILLLPLDNKIQNALIVNALQQASSIVVQNSLQEGFGLTATEGMWKLKPMLVSGAAGLKQQVVHGVHGLINEDPRDLESLAQCLATMLNSPRDRTTWGLNGQIRVIERFTLLTQVCSWLELLATARKG